MQRTSLQLPDGLLDEAVRLSGARTRSEAVALALREFVRRGTARQIPQFRGSGAWSGDLAVVRGDGTPRPGRKRRRP